MHILLIIPTPPDSQQGNTITAKRYAQHFSALGHTSEIANSYTDQSADILIAIHAIKSASSILKWKQHKKKPLILVLGGTDIYRDQYNAKNMYVQSLEYADKIVVLEKPALGKLKKKYHTKTQVIHQSPYQIKNLISLPKPNTFQICVAGHLRDTKNPFFTIEKISKTDLDVQIIHIGKDLTGHMGSLAKNWEKKDSRYKWLGNVSHKEALQIIQQSNLLSHPTLVDSGPSVLIESLTLKTPIISSCIEGNIGVLGHTYKGCFNLNTSDQFIALLQKCIKDKSFYQELQKQCNEREKLFHPKTEQNHLAKILDQVTL